MAAMRLTDAKGWHKEPYMGRGKVTTCKEGDQVHIGDSRVVEIVHIANNGRVRIRVISPDHVTIKGAGIVRAERAEQQQLATTK